MHTSMHACLSFEVCVHIPANLPSGILFNMELLLFGSDHANLPMAVSTTVGFTVLTLIWGINDQAVTNGNAPRVHSNST